MTSDQFAGVLRAIIAGLGGVAAAMGWVTESTVATLGGALVPVAVSVWSVMAKKPAR